MEMKLIFSKKKKTKKTTYRFSRRRWKGESILIRISSENKRSSFAVLNNVIASHHKDEQQTNNNKNKIANIVYGILGILKLIWWHLSVSLCYNRKQQQQLAATNPKIVYSLYFRDCSITHIYFLWLSVCCKKE